MTKDVTKTPCPGTEYETRVDNGLNKPLHRCTTCGRVFRTKRKHAQSHPNTRSHDNTLGILWAYAVETTEVVYPFEIVFDEDEGPHTKCPHCGSEDNINEVDSAIRWNTLYLADDGKTAVASTGSADFEGDGYICTACLNRNISEPEGFEITDWS